MSDSLRDQLLKAGFKPQGKSAGKKKRARKQGKTGKPASTAADLSEKDLARAWSLRQQQEREEAARKKREKQEQQKRQQRINQAVRAIVREHAMERPDDGPVRNFLDRGRIRMVRLGKEQLEQLNSGQLGLVYLTGRYYLLPAKQVEAVHGIDPAHVVDLGKDRDASEEEHPVPDDLHW